MAYRVFFDGMPEVRLTEARMLPQLPKLVIPAFALCKHVPCLPPIDALCEAEPKQEAEALAAAIAKANGLRLGSVDQTADGWRAMLTSKHALRPKRAKCYMPLAEVRFRVSHRRGVGDDEQ